MEFREVQKFTQFNIIKHRILNLKNRWQGEFVDALYFWYESCMNTEPILQVGG